MRSEPVSPSTAIGSTGSASASSTPGAQRVVDVVVDVGDAVDEPHDPALERPRELGARPEWQRMPSRTSSHRFRPSAVALEHVDDAQRVLVVAEPAAEALAQARVEHRLADVAERRVPEVVARGRSPR